MGNETIEVLELMTSGIKVCKFLYYTFNLLLILYLFSQNVKTCFDCIYGIYIVYI